MSQMLLGHYPETRREAAQRNRVSKGEWVRRALKESLLRGGSGSKTNPVARMAALGGPAADIDQIIAEIDEGRC
jgi:hypothetical protein